MDKTPNEYIRWRYAGGEDREAIAKDTMKISDAELELQKTVIDFVYTDPDTAKTTKTKRVIKRLTGERKTNKSTKENDYEVQFKAPYDSDDCKHYYGYKKLVKWGWDKACKKVDVKVAQAASGMFRPLTSSNVESHLKNVGLDAEFATQHAASKFKLCFNLRCFVVSVRCYSPYWVECIRGTSCPSLGLSEGRGAEIARRDNLTHWLISTQV